MNEPRYLVYLCRRCGNPSMTRSNQKTSQCRKCGYVNPVEETRLKILLRTDDMKVAQAAIQHAKTDRKHFPVKKLEPVGRIL